MLLSFARIQVMVMTAGTSRLRKTEAAEADQANPSKEWNDNFNDIKLTGVGGDFEELTNDQGDVFYRPTLTISSKLSSSFEGKMFNETIKNWFGFFRTESGSIFCSFLKAKKKKKNSIKIYKSLPNVLT